MLLELSGNEEARAVLSLLPEVNEVFLFYIYDFLVRGKLFLLLSTNGGYRTLMRYHHIILGVKKTDLNTMSCWSG